MLPGVLLPGYSLLPVAVTQPLSRHGLAEGARGPRTGFAIHARPLLVRYSAVLNSHESLHNRAGHYFFACMPFTIGRSRRYRVNIYGVKPVRWTLAWAHRGACALPPSVQLRTELYVHVLMLFCLCQLSPRQKHTANTPSQLRLFSACVHDAPLTALRPTSYPAVMHCRPRIPLRILTRLMITACRSSA